MKKLLLLTTIVHLASTVFLCNANSIKDNDITIDQDPHYGTTPYEKYEILTIDTTCSIYQSMQETLDSLTSIPSVEVFLWDIDRLSESTLSFHIRDFKFSAITERYPHSIAGVYRHYHNGNSKYFIIQVPDDITTDNIDNKLLFNPSGDVLNVKLSFYPAKPKVKIPPYTCFIAEYDSDGLKIILFHKNVFPSKFPTREILNF
ncbi:MAG: hypothetical protein NC111_03920 [Bacteroides sp.]|nr:hypothetical protein [Bacteroides sp.]MCM1413917.1 hypothetical protein [Bacteroides sp.]MCM1471656.1 hypothetical protein [Bacteroides sp.]